MMPLLPHYQCRLGSKSTSTVYLDFYKAYKKKQKNKKKKREAYFYKFQWFLGAAADIYTNTEVMCVVITGNPRHSLAMFPNSSF